MLTILKEQMVQDLCNQEITTEERIFVIPGVYHVPSIGLNTLSLTQLIAQGFKVNFNGTSCKVLRDFDDEMDDSSKGSASNEDVFENSSDCNDESQDNDLDEEDTMEILEHVQEKAMRAALRYFESIHEKDKRKNDGHIPTKNDFDSFIGFMDMINEQEIMKGCKELVKNHFEKLVTWFYKEFVHTKKRHVPAKIEDLEVSLLDLYLIVKGMHGYEFVNLEKKWKDVATGLGFPIKIASDLKGCYEKYLGLLEAYYKVAKEYSMEELTPTEKGCGQDGDERSTSSNSSEEEMREGSNLASGSTKEEAMKDFGGDEPGKIEDCYMMEDDDDDVPVIKM